MFDGRFNTADRLTPKPTPPKTPDDSGVGTQLGSYVQSRLDSSSTLLDKYGHNCTTVREWSRREKRMYHRVKSGLTRHKGQRLRFLTLTSSEEAEEAVGYDFRILKIRIQRLTPARLVRDHYLKRSELRKYYPHKPVVEPLKFDYFKVETSEGNGVLHILYFGDYIPQKWLSDQWLSIHQSPIVDIRATKKGIGNTRRLTTYVLTQYVSGQSAHIRFSNCVEWVFKGFVSAWNALKDRYGKYQAIEIWERFLTSGWMDVVGSDPPLHEGFDVGFFEKESESERIEREYRRALNNLAVE